MIDWEVMHGLATRANVCVRDIPCLTVGSIFLKVGRQEWLIAFLCSMLTSFC